MANNKNSGFDFDDDLGELNFDSEFTFDEKSSEKPITKIIKSAGRGALDQFKSLKFLKENVVKKLLPKGFGDTLDLAETATNSFKELSSDIKKEIAPSIKEIKKSLPNLIPSDSKYVPKNVKQILEEWKKESNQNTSSLNQEQIRESPIDQTLKDIFKIQETNNLNRANENLANTQIDRSINLKHHKESIYSANRQIESLDRLLDYQYNIDLTFKKKTLELQYKQFFLLKDSLQLAIDDSKKKDAYFNALVHNTALPDSAKIKTKTKDNESYSLFGNKEDFIGKITKSISDNFKEQITSSFSSIADILSEAEMAISMTEGIDKNELLGTSIGTFGADLGTGFFIDKYKNKILNSKLGKKLKLKETGTKLERFNTNLPNLINDFKSKDYTFDDSFKGGVFSFLQNLLPSSGVDKSFKISNNKSILEPFNFTKRSDISINEVIPGYLSKILKEIQIFRSGNENIDEIKFDYNSNSFKGSKNLSKSISKDIFDKDSLSNTKDSLDSIISDIEIKTNTKLSKQSKEVLRKQLLQNSSNKNLANEKYLGNYNLINTSDKTKEELNKTMSMFFKSMSDEEKLSFEEKHNKLTDNIVNKRELIQNYIDTGNISELRKLKLLDKDDNLNIDTILNKYSSSNISNSKEEKENKKINPYLAKVTKQFKTSLDDVKNTDFNKLYSDSKNKISNTYSNIAGTITDLYVLGEKHPRITKISIEMGNYRDKFTNEIITKLEDIQGDIINEKNETVLKADELNNTIIFDSKLKSFKKFISSKFKFASEKSREFYKNNNFVNKDFLTKGKDLLKEKFNSIKDTIKDVYVKGRSKPAMYAEKIKAGLYRSLKTGKVINDAKEIDDDVVDENNQIVISKDDIPNLVVYETRLRRFETLRTLLTPIALLGKAAWWYQTKVAPKWALYNLKVLGKTAKFVSQMVFTGFVKDVYVGNEKNPRLYAEKIKNGYYFLRRTGKVISHHNQVTDEVIDSEGNVIISYDELPELRVYTSALTWLNPFKILAKVGKGIGNTLIGIQKLGFKFAKFNLKLLGKGVKAIGIGLSKLFTETVDVYVKGSNKPILLKKDFKENKYFSAKTGKVISHHSEIDGAVVDQDGNVILTDEEVQSGIYDYTGKVLKGKLVSKAIKGFFKLLNKPFSYRTKLLKAKDLPKSEKDAQSKGYSKTEFASLKTASILDDIKTLLDKKFNKKKTLGDMDDDGIAENSYLDKLKERKARENINAKSTIKKKEDGTKEEKGFFSNLTSILGNAIGSFGKTALSLFGKFNSALLGFLPKLGSLISSGGSLLSNIPGVGKVGKFLKSAGGKLLGGAAGLALGAYEAYQGFSEANKKLEAGEINEQEAKELKGGALGGLAGGAGGAALGATIGSFILPGVGTLIGSGIGYLAGSYFGEKAGSKLVAYFSKKPDTSKKGNSLEMFRYVQYGFTRDNLNYLDKILGLETYLTQFIKVSGSNPIIEEDNIYIKKIADVFNLDPGNKYHLELLFEWYQFRFKPIFLKHISAINSLTGKTNLDEIKNLDDKNFNLYLDSIKGLDSYYNYNKLPLIGVKIRVSDSSDVYKELQNLLSIINLKTSKETPTASIKTISSTNYKANQNNVNPTDFIEKNNFTNFENKERQKSLVGLNISGESLITTDSKMISALDAVKYKTYGLVDLEESKINNLKYLENKVKPYITFKNNIAIFNGNPNEILSSCSGIFNINIFDLNQTRSFSIWFTDRFLVTYLTYLTGIKTYLNKNPFEDNLSNQLSIKDQNSLARKLISIPAWYVNYSPWKGYKINSNIGSTNNNINYLDSLNKKVVLEEQGKISKEESSTSLLKENTPNIQKISYNKDSKPIQDHPDAEEEIKGQSIINNDSYSTGSLKVAGGPLFEGRNAFSFINLGKGANLKGLNPEMAKNLYGMIEEYGTLTGKKVNINSGFRSIEEQEKLYKQFGPGRAAKPGSSLHEYGLAVDINSDVLSDMEKMGLMRKYGFTRPVGGESWHVEPIGIQTNIAKYKVDSVAAELAIKSGLGKGGGGMGIVKNAPKYSRNLDLVKSIINGTGSTIAFKSKDNSLNLVSSNDSNNDLQTKSNRLELGNTSFTKVSYNPSAEDGMDVGNNLTFKPVVASISQNTNTKLPIDEIVDPKEAISKASKLVGVDENTLLKIAAIESGFNPNAKAKTSTAGGLFQFTDSTWNYLLDKYGKKYGLGNDTSKYSVKANALMAAHYVKDSIKTLGPDANANSIYLSHFLGPTGAKTLLNNLNNNPDELGVKILPNAAKSNKSIFYKDGKPRTVSEIYALIDNKMQAKSKEFKLDLPDTQFANNSPNSFNNDVKVIKASYTPLTKKEESLENISKKRAPNNSFLSIPKFESKNDNTIPQPILKVDENVLSKTNKILTDSLEVQKEMVQKLDDIKKLLDNNKIQNNNLPNSNNLKPYDSANPKVLMNRDSKYT